MIIICVSATVACSDKASPTGHLQLKLPKALREISGLALLPDGRLLAVADEKAEVFVIDMDVPEVTAYTQLGNKPVRGDFEGIAVLAEHLYLITSDGLLWQQALGSNEPSYQQFDTGLREACEIEGLTTQPTLNRLLILCKTPYAQELKGHLNIFAWSIETQQRTPQADIKIELASIGLKKFNGSGLSFNPRSKTIMVVAAKQARYIELAPDLSVIRQGKLPNAGKHAQTEGIEIDAKNRLYLADEGGKGRGKLIRYDSGI